MELETCLRGIFRGTKCVDSNRRQFNRLLKAVGREAKTNCSLWTLLSPGICKQTRQIRRFTLKLGSKCTQSSSHLSKSQWTSSILCHVHNKPQFILPFVRCPLTIFNKSEYFQCSYYSDVEMWNSENGKQKVLVNMSSVRKERTENAK